MMSLNKLKTAFISLCLWSGTVSAGPVVDSFYSEPILNICNAFMIAYSNGIMEISLGHTKIEETFVPENLSDPSDLAVYQDILNAGMVTALSHQKNGGTVDKPYALNIYDNLVEGCIATQGHPSIIIGLPNISEKSVELYKDIYSKAPQGTKMHYIVSTASSKNVADPRGVWATIEGCAGQRGLWERQCAFNTPIEGESEAQIIESIKKAAAGCTNYSLTKFFECTNNFIDRKKTLSEEIEKDL